MRKTKSAGDDIVTMDRRSTKDRRSQPRTAQANKPRESQAGNSKATGTKATGTKATGTKASTTKAANANPAHLSAPEAKQSESNDHRFQADRRNRESVPENMAKLIAEEKRKVKVQRRRQIDPTTCERDYSDDEIAFMQAMDEYKRKNGRMFPTCSEILEVVRAIGYAKVAPAQPTAPPPTSED